MSPLMIVHIAAGSLGILSGAAALSVRKGERLHRGFGTVFFAAMPPLPYFLVAVFVAFIAALDLSIVLRGGVSGRRRIARHLWRMCMALTFGAGFFFLGQQEVLPAFLRGSPILFLPELAPLALMLFWLVRVLFTRAWRDDAVAPAST